MIREILFTSRLDDDKRLYEILSQQKARLQSSLAAAGHSTAVMRAASYYSPVSNFQDRIAGIGYFRLVEKLEKHFRWFYTYYTYTCDFQEIKDKGPIPVSYTHLTLPTNREV